MSKLGDSGPKSAKIIAITSGKGGVGKTSLTVNTGIALARRGYKVCLFDADSNLANINIMLKVMPEHTLEHVLRGEKSISGIMIEKLGVSLVPGAFGITDFDRLERMEKQRMIHALNRLEKKFDYILVDTSAGIHENVLSFLEKAHHCLIVITPEPTSLTDAFSLVRVLKKRGNKKRLNVVVNSAPSELNARKTYKRFSMAVAKYIGSKVAYLGYIIKDRSLAEAICSQNPVVVEKPGAFSSKCFERLAFTLGRLSEASPQEESLSVFLKKEESKKLPDFSETAALKASRHQHVIDSARLTKRQMLIDHKNSILDFIDDPDMTKQEVTETLSGFIDAYRKRFGGYPIDAVNALNDDLEHNNISQAKIAELLKSLQLFYKDNFPRFDKDWSAQYLCQLVNSYVEQHRSFPFDPIYILYQAMDIGDLDQNQICNLLFTLNMAYKGQADGKPGELHDSHNLVYCAERNNKELEQLTSLIQEKYLGHYQDQVNKHSVAEINQRQQPAKSLSEAAESLLDSIKYASLAD